MHTHTKKKQERERQRREKLRKSLVLKRRYMRLLHPEIVRE
jgi:hypothetical protein